MNEMVVLVDEKDNTLGEMDKLEAHREALLHRAVSVFVFNSEGSYCCRKELSASTIRPGYGPIPHAHTLIPASQMRRL